VTLTPLDLGLLALAALGGGAVNALAGGGTLITFPALIAVGVPPLNANTTNTVALVPGYLGGTLGQRHDLRGQRRRVWVMLAPAVAGGVLGGVLLLLSGEKLFGQLVPWLILLATALLAAEPWLKKTAVRRLRSHDAAGRTGVAGVAAAFAGAVYGGYFGAGLGIILLSLFSLVLPDSLTRVNALKQAISFFANAAAAVLFASAGGVVWSAAAVMAVGALIGGSLGGRFAGRVPATTLRTVVVVLGIAIAVVYFVK
jgi:uncharacterized protein